MKKAHKQIDTKGQQTSVYCNSAWIWGLIILIFSSVLTVVTFPYIEVVMISILSAMTVLFNAIVSVRMNDEKLTKTDALAFIFICFGTILCISYSNTEQRDYSS